MKHLKKIAAAALAAAALAALLGPGSASATTMEIGGVRQGPIGIVASLKAGTSSILRDTFGFSANTCTTSSIAVTTQVTTGATVTAPVASLSFSNCTNEPVVVHKGGTLHVSHITSTTNGTVTSSGAQFTVNSPFGTLTCVTGGGTHIGNLVGSASGHAEVIVHAHVNCGVSAIWDATYTVTTPTGLGVVS